MKKLLSVKMLSLLLVATLILGGCGKKEDPIVTPDETPTEIVTSPENPEVSDVKVTIFQSKIEIAEQLEKVAEEYTKDTGVTVEVWGAAGDDYRSQLQGHMAGGEGPVIFSTHGETELEQFSKYLADLTNEPYAANISEGLALEKDGKVYGIPYGIEAYGLIINKSLIDEKVDLKDLETLTAMFSRLADEGKSPVVLSQEAYFLSAHALNTPFALQDDYADFVEKLNNGEVKMAETPEFKEYAEFMNLVREKSLNPLEVTYDSQTAGFADGNYAAIHQGNWAYGMFKDYDLDFDMTIAPLPISGNQNISVGVGAYWSVNSEASPEQQKAAHDFLNYLLNTEAGLKILVDVFGFIPPFSNVEYKAEDPLSQATFDYASAGKSLPWTFPIWPQGIIETSLTPAIENFFIDPSMDTNAFLISLDEAWASAPK